MARQQTSSLVVFIMCCCIILFACTTSILGVHVVYPTEEHPVMYMTTTWVLPDPKFVDGHQFGLGYYISLISSQSGIPTDLRCAVYDAGFNSTILTQWVVTDFPAYGTGGGEYPAFFEFPSSPLKRSQLLTVRCALTFSVLPIMYNEEQSSVLSPARFQLEFQRTQPHMMFWNVIDDLKLFSLPSWNNEVLMNNLLRTTDKQYLAALTDNSVTPRRLHDEKVLPYIKAVDDFKPLAWSFAIDNTKLAKIFINETLIPKNLNTLRIGSIGRGWLAAVDVEDLKDQQYLTCYINNLPIVANYSQGQGNDSPSIWINLEHINTQTGEKNLGVLLQAMFPSLTYDTNIAKNNGNYANLNLTSLKPANILTFDCGIDFPLVLPETINPSEDLWTQTEIHNNNAVVVDAEILLKKPTTKTTAIPQYLSDIIMSVEFGWVEHDAPSTLFKRWVPNQRFGQAIAQLTMNAKQTQKLIQSQTQFPRTIFKKSAENFVQPSAINFVVNNGTQYDYLQCSGGVSFGNKVGIKPYLRLDRDIVDDDDKEIVFITIPKLNKETFILANGDFNNTWEERAAQRPDRIDPVDDDALLRNTMVTFTLVFGDSQNEKTVGNIMVVPDIINTSRQQDGYIAGWVETGDSMQLEVQFSTSHFFPGKTPDEIQQIWDANPGYEDQIGIIMDVFMYGRFINKEVVKFDSQSFNTAQCIFEYHHNRHTTSAGSVSIFTSPLPITYIHEYTIGKVAYNNNTRNILELQYVGNNDNILLRTVNHHNSFKVNNIYGRWTSPSYVPSYIDMKYNDSPINSAANTQMVMNGITQQGLPKQLISWSYTMDNTKLIKPWYAFEHIAAMKAWGNVKYELTPYSTNTVVISQYGGFINRNVAEVTLKRAPIVWKQTVTIEIVNGKDISKNQLLQIPMIIAFDKTASLNSIHSTNGVSSTIGQKPPLTIPSQPKDNEDEDHPPKK